MEFVPRNQQRERFPVGQTDDKMTSKMKAETVHGKEINNASQGIPWIQTGKASWCTWQKALLIALIILSVIFLIVVIVIGVYLGRLSGSVSLNMVDDPAYLNVIVKSNERTIDC
ncbi:unnamed protein product [Rotaria magnacalcarata]